MTINTTALDGVLVITPKRHGDERGFFSEMFHQQRFAEYVPDTLFVQDNMSLSRQQGTVRGLHFQKPPHAQGKLVSCLQGCILDVAVDIRRGSPTYGQHVAMELSADNGRQLWIPAGFAHAFCTLTPDCLVAYKVTDHYSTADDAGIRWNDPALNIDWPVTAADAQVSAKDASLPLLEAIESPFTYQPGRERNAA